MLRWIHAGVCVRACVQAGRVPVEHNPGSEALRTLLGPPPPPTPPPSPAAAAVHVGAPRRDAPSPVLLPPPSSPSASGEKPGVESPPTASLRAADMGPSPSPRASLSARIRNQVPTRSVCSCPRTTPEWSCDDATNPSRRAVEQVRQSRDEESSAAGCAREPWSVRIRWEGEGLASGDAATAEAMDGELQELMGAELRRAVLAEEAGDDGEPKTLNNKFLEKYQLGRLNLFTAD